MRARVALGLVLAWTASAWAQAPPAPDLAVTLEALRAGPDTITRIDAARRMGASRDPRAADALIAVLEDPKRDVRWAAIEALGELGDRRAIPKLVEYLKRAEAYRWGKRLVANALGAIGDGGAVGPLSELLSDEDPFLRRVAALALVRIGDADGLARVAELAADASDETLGTVRRELVRAEQRRGDARAARTVSAAPAAPLPLRPREWAGLRVGQAPLADARQRFGRPIQETADSLLFRGDAVPGALRAESVTVNGDVRGVVDSIFVVPAWGTLDRDVRALLGRGQVMAYGEYVRAAGLKTAGAGTRAGEKLHYLPPDLVTETYGEMGVLVVYESVDATARDRPVKLLIIH